MKLNSSINVRIDKDLRTAFMHKCKQNNMKYSKLIRKFIEEFLEEETK